MLYNDRSFEWETRAQGNRVWLRLFAAGVSHYVVYPSVHLLVGTSPEDR
jgi:hypothetical protein